MASDSFHVVSSSSGTSAIAAADVDNDGGASRTLRLKRVEPPSHNRQSACILTPPPRRATPLTTLTILLATDLDLIIADAHGWYTGLFINSDGAGTFTCSPTLRFPTIQNVPVYAIATADVDNDGDIDVVLGTAGVNKLLVNDGLGNFDESPKSIGTAKATSYAIAAADVDGDGGERSIPIAVQHCLRSPRIACVLVLV